MREAFTGDERAGDIVECGGFVCFVCECKGGCRLHCHDGYRLLCSFLLDVFFFSPPKFISNVFHNLYCRVLI